MLEGTLAWVAEATGGELQGADLRFAGLGTDTRSLNAGELFVALRGERFDAHELVAEAQARGAAAAVVDRPVQAPGLSLIVVADTRRALGDLARAWRRRFAIPVIAITGSNGKTTTKEMVASILREQGATLATLGNLNNDIGVPLTLFRLAASDRYAVIEMGANGPDDITSLVAIAEPTVALVTMCGPAHLQGFGSLDGVARAKGQIYSRLNSTHTALINVDDPHHARWQSTAGAARILRFGLGADATVTATDIQPGGLGAGSQFRLRVGGEAAMVTLPLDGLHNVRNAVAAAAVGAALDLPIAVIKAGLEAVPPVKGRLNVRRLPTGATLIDDTYNANPASLAAALDLLATQPGSRWLVLADMGELGPSAVELHRAAGLAARAAGVSRLFAIGPLAAAAAEAFGAEALRFITRDDALAALRDQLIGDVTVLCKGSRSMQLDLLVKALLTPAEGALCC